MGSATQLTDALGITMAFDPGTILKHLLLGSDQIGNDAVVRFYVLHCIFLPFLMMIFISIHIWQIRKSSGLSRLDRISSQLPENDLVHTIPHALSREFTVFIFILAIVTALSCFFDAP